MTTTSSPDEDAQPTTQPQTVGGASANQRFRRMWAALGTSSMGTAVSAVALPLVAVSVIDATPVQIGLIAGATYFAWICIGLPAGVIVQRLPLRGTQVSMDVLRAAALASVPVAWAFDRLYWWQLLAVALVISFSTVLFDVGNATFMTSVVPKRELQQRNSLISGTESTAQLAGPSLGGVLVQMLGAVPTLLVDAGSYVVSAVLLRTLPRVPVVKPDTWPPIGRMIADGWRYVVRHPVIGPTMVTATVVNFVAGVHLALFPVYLVRELGTPAWLVGVLFASEGVGSLAGAALAPRVTGLLGTARSLLAAGAVSACGATVLAVGAGHTAEVLFALGVILFGIGVVTISVTTRTYRQIESPPELLPRVMATVRFVSWGAVPLGSLIAGAAATPLSARTVLIMSGVLTAVAPTLLLLSRIGRYRDLVDVPTGR